MIFFYHAGEVGGGGIIVTDWLLVFRMNPVNAFSTKVEMLNKNH